MQKKPGPVILGFDPGTQVTGWGVIRMMANPQLLDYGVLRPPKGKPLESRLHFLFSSALQILAEIQPDYVAVEDPFVGNSAKSALTLGQARGALLVAAVEKGITVASYPPRSIKSAVAGRGNATKEQVQFMVQRLLRMKEPPTPLDASDALAVALCHSHRVKMDRMTQQGKRK